MKLFQGEDDAFLEPFPPSLPQASAPPQQSVEPEAKKQKGSVPLAAKVLRKLTKATHKFHADCVHLQVDTDDPYRLWCQVCGTGFGTRKNIWTKHLESSSHSKAVTASVEQQRKVDEEKRARLEGNVTGQLTMFDALSLYKFNQRKREEKMQAEEEHRRVAERNQMHRLRIIRLCDERGIPLSVLDGDFLEVLEEARPFRLSLGDASNLRREFGDQIFAQRIRHLQEAHHIPDAAICLTLDAASHGHAEVLYGVTRVVTPTFAISHHLVIAARFPRPLNAQQYVQAAHDAQKCLHLPGWTLGNSDGCSTMVKYVETMTAFYKGYTHVLCISHLIQKVPSKWKFANLPKMLAAWNLVFKNSLAARALFTSVVGSRWIRKHKIRWNATSAQIAQIGASWGKLPEVVSRIQAAKLCKEAVKELITRAGIPVGTSEADVRAYTFSQTAFEVAAWMDMAPRIVQLTTFAEGASFELPFVWSRIQEIKFAFSQVLTTKDVPAKWMPELFSLLQKYRERGGVVSPSLWAGIQNVFRAGSDYLGLCLGPQGCDPDEGVRYADSVAVLKIAQSIHPAIWMRFLTDASRSQEFVWSTLLDNDAVANMFGPALVAELKDDHASLLALYSSLGMPIPFMDPKELLAFWQNAEHRRAAKSWAKAAQVFCALLPNSVLCERAGSVVRARLDDRSEGQMSDQTFFCVASAAFAYAEARSD